MIKISVILYLLVPALRSPKARGLGHLWKAVTLLCLKMCKLCSPVFVSTALIRMTFTVKALYAAIFSLASRFRFSMLTTMHQGWSSIRSRIESLLLRDKHKKKHLTLGHSTLYVLPSKLGLGFLLIAVLNFILAANYQNNLVQVVSYLMLVLVLMS
mgnify:CR=1 FL=1